MNSIPESAQASIDFRSTSAEQLTRLEVALHRAVEDSVQRTNAAVKPGAAQGRGLLSFSIAKIGDRPAAQLPGDSPLFETLRAVDRHLGLRSDFRLGSTDANIPLSLGVPAFRWVLEETAAGRIPRPSGTPPRIEKWDSGGYCC